MDEELKKNGEGYPDLTAYEAIKRAEYESDRERFRKLIGAIHRICELADFKLEEHVVVTDLRSGRVWR